MRTARHTGMVLILSLAAVIHGPSARADFVNGDFSIPNFSGWIVEYNHYLGGGPLTPSYQHSPWLTALPGGHPAPSVVASATVAGVNFAPPCNANMALINNLTGGYHATRISQSVFLSNNEINDCGSACIQVCWIAVLEDAGDDHPSAAQPFFHIELKHGTSVLHSVAVTGDATGSWSRIGSSNTFYRVMQTPLIIYNANTTAPVSLTMTVSDCSYGAHGALAMLDSVHVVPAGGFSFAPSANWSSTNPGPLGFHAGDFNGDGRDDLANYAGSGVVQILLSNGTTGFAPPIFWNTPFTSTNEMHAGDFNGDGRSDVALRTGTTTRLLLATAGAASYSNASFSNGGTGLGGRFWVGDFTGDGISDFVRIANNSSMQVYRGPVFAAEVWATSMIPPQDGYYVGDFNGDTLDDLMKADGFGAHVMLATRISGSPGFKFSNPVKWTGHTVGVGGWVVGDFNCDNKADLIRRTGNGAAEALYSTGSKFDNPTIVALAGQIPPNLTLFSRVAKLLAGDFNGDGRDDLSPPSILSAQVALHCGSPCACMYAVAGTPECDPNDPTLYHVPITITNRTRQTMTSVGTSALGAFVVSPTSIPLSPPLLHGKSRTIMVDVSGVSFGTQYCIELSTLVCPDLSCLCRRQVCFTPPECDCMQITSDRFFCEVGPPAGLWYEFSVQHLGVSTARTVRLNPPTNFAPSMFTLNPYPAPTGPLRTQIITPPSNGVLCWTVEFYDQFNNHLPCDKEYCLDVPQCPFPLGYCCTATRGCIMTTPSACTTALGGTFSTSSAICFGCLIDLRPTLPMTSFFLPDDGDVVSNDDDGNIVLHTTQPGTAVGGELFFPSAREFDVTLGATSSDMPANASLRLAARGTRIMAPDSPLGELRLSRSETGYRAETLFDMFNPAPRLALIFDGELVESVPVLPNIGASLAAWPTNILLVRNPELGSMHGFALRFDEPTTVSIDGAPGSWQARELHLMQLDSLIPEDSFTSLALEATNLPLLGMASVDVQTTPCDGDLNGDRQIDLSDLALMLSSFGANQEGDIDADGATGLTDLAILLSRFGSTCP